MIAVSRYAKLIVADGEQSQFDLPGRGTLILLGSPRIDPAMLQGRPCQEKDLGAIADTWPHHHLLFINCQSPCLHFRCARAGFRPVYAYQSGDGDIWLSSHLRPLRFLVAGLSADPIGIIDQLAVSACTHRRTLLSGVSRVPDGSALRISRDARGMPDLGISEIREPSKVIHKRAIRKVSQMEELLDLTKRVIERTLPEDGLCVALSGGLDSRFLLLAAIQSGRDASAITLGRKDWIDPRIASEVTSRLGVPHELVPPPAAVTISEYLGVLNETEHLSDYLSPFWLERFRDSLAKTSLPVANGFLGGPITGGLVTEEAPPLLSPMSQVEKWLDEINRCAVRWSVLDRLLKACIPDQKRRIVNYAYSLVEDQAKPTHSLEMLFRQSGFVALNTANLYSLYCEVRTPFSDPLLFEFFSHLPTSLLKNQKLYREALGLIDRSGAPFVSTTARLFRPDTFTRGPQQFIYRQFQMLRMEMRRVVLDNRRAIDPLFNSENVAGAIETAGLMPREGQASFTEVIAVFNAVLWWLHAGGIPCKR